MTEKPNTDKKSPQGTIFRKAALEKLSSPEKLDQLIRIIDPRSWMILVAFAIVIAGFVLWGFFGVLKTQVHGYGMIVGEGVHEIVPVSGGQITRVFVEVGDSVTAGDIIAEISQTELLFEISEAKSRLDDLRFEYLQLQSFGSQDTKLQSEFILKQRTSIKHDIEVAEKNRDLYLQQLETENELLKKGLVTRQQLISTNQKVDAEKVRIESLKADLEAISSQELNIGFNLDQQLNASRQRVGEMERLIQKLQTKFEEQSRVKTTFSGTVLEILASQGEVVPPGGAIVKIGESIQETGSLKGILYVHAEDGKKIREGMEVLMVPSTVMPQEYGYMVGNVSYISEYPATRQGMMHELKNPQLVEELSQYGAPFEAHVKFEMDSTTYNGFKWTSHLGPPTGVYAGTPCKGRITTELQKPVSLVIPSLRSVVETH